MPKVYPARKIIKLLIHYHFHQVSQKGSHAKFKDTHGHTAIVPIHAKDIPFGTFRSILKQADISFIDAKKFLDT